MNLKNGKLVLLLLILICTYTFSEKPVPVRVSFINPVGDTVKLRQVANSFLEPNTLGFSKAETYESGIKLLQKSSYFTTVDTATVRNIKQVSLKPAYVLKGITIKGKFPLFKKDILDAMTIRSGIHLSDDLLQKQKKIISDRLEDFGFIKPSITFDQNFIDSTGEVDLFITIEKEGLYRINSLALVGDKKYGLIRSFWAKIYSKLWRNGNGYYSKDEIKESVDKLTRFYRGYGYYEAEVTCETYFDDKEKSVSLVIKIEKGPQYKIDMSRDVRGPLSRRELRDQLDFSRKGNKGDFTLKRRMYSLQKTLRQRGYEKARVSFDDTILSDKGKPIRHIKLDVQEGSRQKVALISTMGNLHMPLDTMQELMLTKYIKGDIKKNGEGSFSRAILKKDIESIEALYMQKGFPFVQIKSEVTSSGKDALALSINVEEGRRVVVDSIQIKGLESQKLLKTYLTTALPVKVGEPFSLGRVLQSSDTLGVLLRREGYHDGKVAPTVTFSEDSSTVKVTLTVDSGKKVHFNRIFFHGNFKTRAKLMTRVLELETGDIYSDKKLYDGIRKLRNIQNFKTVSYSVPERGGDREKLDLFISVDERKPFLLGGAAGYEEEKQFYGRLYAENRNFLGLDKQLRVEGELGLELEKNEEGSTRNFTSHPQGELNLSYTEPHLFYQDIIASTKLYLFRRPQGEIENYLELGNSYNLTWKFTPNFTGFGKLALEFRGLQDSNRKGLALELAPGISYDKRDSFIRPRKGFVARLNAAISYGITLDEDNFIKYTGEIKHYVTPVKGITFASRIGGGVIDLYGEADSLKGDEAFVLGGSSSIRGYEKKMLYHKKIVTDNGTTFEPQAGYLSLYGSLESRIALPYSFEATLFADGGTLGFSNKLNSLELPRFSYGGGLRYVTPVGSIGMVFGRKSRKNITTADDLEYYGDNKYKWDFSINYTF